LLAVTAVLHAQNTQTGSPAKAAEYSQQGYVVEHLRTSYRLESDGTGRREIYARVKVQSEAGVREFGRLAFGYNSANERVEIAFLRVLRADGTVVTAPPTRCRI
jgi:hypothetical protein